MCFVYHGNVAPGFHYVDSSSFASKEGDSMIMLRYSRHVKEPCYHCRYATTRTIRIPLLPTLRNNL
jgi:hypothetical protein